MGTNFEIQVHRSKPWAAVPESLIVDQRLGHAAVRLGCWLAGRPDGWVVRKHHAKMVLGLGEDAWDRACRELKHAGYLRTTMLRQEGRFVGLSWTFDLYPAAADGTTGGGFSAPGSAAPGSAGGGEPVYLATTNKTRTIKQKQPQQPPAAAVVVAGIEQKLIDTALPRFEGPQSDDLVYPACLPVDQRNAARLLLAGLGDTEAQVVLDEVEGAAQRQREIKNPLGLIRHLAGLAAAGNLVAELAPDVRTTRLARAAHIARMSAEQPQAVLRQAGEPQTQLGPEAALARQRARAQIEAMRKSKN
nr:hypothetical protein [uncultured Rhodoferax sp.]